ncbi:MAG: hypothetical protein IKM05_02490 [Clostridia bacterium]|nr:hypothetical protein [Clostridia bacterium]
MYRNSFQPSGNVNTRRRYRIVLILCVIFFLSTVALAVTVGSNAAFRTNTVNKLNQRTRSAIGNAISEAEKLDGSVISGTSSQLGRVRQNVYLAEQLSSMSVELSGEDARLIPLSFFSSNRDIYDTLDDYDQLVQGGVSNTHDLKTELLNQLYNLQHYLSEE